MSYGALTKPASVEGFVSGNGRVRTIVFIYPELPECRSDDCMAPDAPYSEVDPEFQLSREFGEGDRN